MSAEELGAKPGAARLSELDREADRAGAERAALSDKLSTVDLPDDSPEPSAAKPPAGLLSGFAGRLASFYFADTISMVGYFIITPKLLAHLGHAQYGLLAVAGALTGYLGLLNLGVGPSLTRFVAAAHAKGDAARVRQLVSAAVVAFVGAGVVGLAVAIFASQRAATLFSVPPEVVGVASAFLIIKGVQFAVMLPLEAFAGANYGLLRIAEMNAIRSLGTLLELGSWVFIIWQGYGLVELGLIALATAALTGLLQWVLLKRTLTGPILSLRSVDRATIWELVRYGVFFSLDAVVVLLVFKTDEIVIGAVLGVSAIALYAVLNQVIQSALSLVVRISSTLYPSFAALAARAEKAELARVYQMATDGALLLATGLCVVMGFFGPEAARLWLKVEEVPSAVLVVLTCVIVAHTPVSVASKLIAATGLLPRIALISVAEGVLNLLLSLLLIGRYGLTGVAVATLLAQLGTTTWFNPRLACRELGINVTRFWLGRLWRVSLAALPSLAVAALLFYYLTPRGVGPVLGAAGVTALVHAGASVFVFRRFVTRGPTLAATVSSG